MCVGLINLRETCAFSLVIFHRRKNSKELVSPQNLIVAVRLTAVINVHLELGLGDFYEDTF
jgi:hypothetical protein